MRLLVQMEVGGRSTCLAATLRNGIHHHPNQRKAAKPLSWRMDIDGITSWAPLPKRQILFIRNQGKIPGQARYLKKQIQ